MKGPKSHPLSVYFTASVVGKKQYLSHYQTIIRILTSKGYSVQSDHIINVTESEIHLKSRETRLKFLKQLEKWIQNADFVIAEISFPSISVGYEISMALQYRKPILLLYANESPPSLMAYHTNELLVCEKYTRATAEDIIKDFIRFIRGASDTRFTFFITSHIASYLEKVSKKEKMPKSVYLRKLIETHIRQHPLS